jgi:pyruvate dehydrogenase E2 component (dihydrolipoamide acetyltransferase)
VTAQERAGGVEVRVPDIGSDEKVDVIEILVAPGEEVAVEDGLVTLESDKATMDIPSPRAGVVGKIKVKVGDKVGQGDLVLELLPAGAGAEDPKRPASAPADGSAATAEPGPHERRSWPVTPITTPRSSSSAPAPAATLPPTAPPTSARR